MSRKLTDRNRDHPHYLLKEFEENVYKAHQGLSAAALDKLCETEAIDLKLSRKRKIETLCAKYTVRWKEKWQKTRGWDFDDIYDPVKFKQHVTNDMRKAAQVKKQLNELKMQAYDHRPLDKDGNPIVKEVFDKMPKAEQDEIRENLRGRVNKIINSGYGGILPNGNIVDRRAYPDAVPFQESTTLGSPPPKPLIPELAVA